MKKIVLLSSIIIVMIVGVYSINTNAAISNKAPIKVGVLLYKEDDYFISLVRDNLLKIENDNKDIVDFIFYDGKANQELQNKQVDEAINNKVDLILVNLVDINQSDTVINKAKENNLPIILFSGEPLSLNGIKSYGKSLYIGTEGCESGNLQGEMIVKEWNNRNIIDRNGDNKIQYVLLQGEKNDLEAQYRSECVIRTINQKGIQSSELASEFCNWDKECARIRVESLFLRYGDTIELIISNNDEMAIGAIMALQKKGYNMGDPNKYIPVVGIDGIDEAKKLIENGLMTGTVIQDAEGMAEALYRIGMNLAQNKKPLSDTDYKFDSTGVAVRIPYKGYIIRNSPNL